MIYFLIHLITGVMMLNESIRAQDVKAHPVILVHGGAGNLTRDNISSTREKGIREGLKKALEEGYRVLIEGGSSFEAVKLAVMVLEDSPFFNAGRGSVPNEKGDVQMDAAIMYGPKREAGAVAAVQIIKNPIVAAYYVMKYTNHVLLVGKDADDFAIQHKLEIRDKSYFIVEDKNIGETVGAVAVDIYGNVSAATSTGGLRNKKPGRVGDTPIIGAGTYATPRVAVSTTGIGEYFIRISAGSKIAFYVEEMNFSLYDAVYRVLDECKSLGGQGGIIAVDYTGNYVMLFNSPGMARGVKGTKDNIEKIMIFGDEK